MDSLDSALDHVAGACAIGRGTGRLVTIGNMHQSLCWVVVSTWVWCTSRFLVTLGIGVSTLGSGASTLGRCGACRAAWVAQTLLQFALAFAALFVANIILVNSLLIVCNASAVSLPVGIFPWSTIISC
jgi:hypothetical protein